MSQGQEQGQGQPISSVREGIAIRPPRDQHGASRYSDEPMNEDFDMDHNMTNHAHAHGDMHYHGGYTHSHDHAHGNGHSHSHDHGHSHSHEHSHNNHGRGIELDKDDDVHEEVLHFHKIVKAFSQYKVSALYANHRRRTDFYSLPERQQMLLPSYLERMEQIDEAIEANFEIIKIICEDQQIFVNDDRPLAKLDMHDRAKNAAALRIREQDMEKVQGTIKQFVRDWSTGGKPERDAIYGPMVQELKSCFASVPKEDRGSLNVLVPGSGLGRLAFDIAHEGFSCQGNEFSYYMLLASNFILNKTTQVDQFTIYPYIHSFSNIVRSQDVLTPALIPDVSPSEIPTGTDFSMVAGDFLEVYGEEAENYGKWDAVVTCFFIDTAKNIVDYLETIHKILKKGGVWINAGPLLWHFENTANEISIELSLEEVLALVEKLGFKIETQGKAKSTYMANPHGMLQYVYDCSTWTAIKL
ncbi:hypothetical protein BGZ92_010802 [Podila epicladia]|nr:hypothetical protein BGZ92_010802 [Podila epicladia]